LRKEAGTLPVILNISGSNAKRPDFYFTDNSDRPEVLHCPLGATIIRVNIKPESRNRQWIPSAEALVESRMAFPQVMKANEMTECGCIRKNVVILALEEGSELPARETGSLYRVQIAHNLPNLVVCARE
jgi:hypothetical protein